MANALVSMVMTKIRDALVSKVMNKLGEEVYSIGSAQAELEKISFTFESIQALLNDAEIIQFHKEGMQVWLKKLKDVAYDVEDLLDEMIPWPEPESRTDDGDDQQRMENQAWTWLFSLFTCCGLEDWIRLAHDSWTDGDDTDNGSIGDKVRTFFPTFFNKVASQRNFAHRLKEVSAKLDQIAADKRNFIFTEIHSFRGGSHLDKAQFQTSSRVDESQMLGREEEKNIIISKLTSGSSDEEGRIHVISIIGVGGLGKTTLAQLICKDERVKSHFHKVLWVCVSDDFNVINLIKAIIEAAGGTSPPHSDQPDSLQNKLDEKLRGKRFLLVLDDVWNDNSEEWKKLWLSFENGAHGSKILVTTRSKKVANTCMPSAYMHELKGLSDDDCWLLFSSRAFTGRKVVDYPTLEKIGRKIVKKCKGVPLSVKVMGSVMHSKRTAQDWQDILESETWKIPDIAEGILPALLLSYYNLPVHLKQCFAYCSVFPKDYVMEKDILVNLWLAHGFIKPQGRREMEAIGEEYFDELVALSLFQKVVDEFDYDEEEEEEQEQEEEQEVRCTIHDLLHDLAQFLTKNEYCVFENGKSGSSSVTARHSSFVDNRETPEIPAALCDAKNLRTLLQIESSFFGRLSISTIPDNLFQCARSLRALDFSIKELPSSVGSLKHLRCLDLSYSEIVELPESVTHLRNLLTLKLTNCKELDRLPRGMGKLVSLRYLDLSNSKIVELPESVTHLRNLLTLKLTDCKELDRLPIGMGELVSLRYLDLSSSDIVELPESVTLLRNLQTLKLNCCKFDVLPRGMGKLVSLRYLDLTYSSIVELPESVTHLRNLQTLKLNACYHLQRLPSGMSAMVHLRHLEIESTLALKYLPEGLGGISSLLTLSRFIVGGDGGCKIGELKRLNSIQGKLSIEMLKRVCNGDEAKEAELDKKLDLRVLFLQMSGDYDLEMSGDDVERMDDVLEALRPPHKNLKKLVIKNCIGSKFPTWMKDLPFSNLVDLRLISCNKCTQLPGLGRLPSLKYLQIEGGLVKRVGSEFYGNSSGGGINGVAFPKLEKLEFGFMYEFEEWELRLEDGEIMPSLQTLNVDFCGKLRSLPGHLGQLKSLSSLHIKFCLELQSLPQGLRGLTYLEINGSTMLAERCKGEDWSNISHIPNIIIDQKRIK